MDDVVSATSPAQTTSFDASFSDNIEPLAPTLEDARGALNILQDHMKQGDQLSLFDYLCFEHLRERLMASQLQFCEPSREGHSFAESMSQPVQSPTL